MGIGLRRYLSAAGDLFVRPIVKWATLHISEEHYSENVPLM